MKVLLLRLESPLISFGGVSVDSLGVIDDLPSASLLTGLLGNALGYRRTMVEELQGLQDRLRFVVRIDRPGQRLTDYQTADLHADDKAWTTHGVPEGRAGGAGSYEGQHQRYRDYHADAAATVALCLDRTDASPTLDDLAHALDYPVRPLFIGRKPCLPSERLLLGIVDADGLLEALPHAVLADGACPPTRLFAPASSIGDPGNLKFHGLRNWVSGVHEGMQWWTEVATETAT
jgi:CRISPR system Cascade subunit CasD